jgi:methyl-accepting chemotaxis protein
MNVNNPMNVNNAMNVNNSMNVNNAMNVNNPMNVNPIVSCPINVPQNKSKKVLFTFLVPKIPKITIPTFPNPIEYIKKKFTFDMKSFKIMIIAMLNVLATQEGQRLFKSLLKALDPAMKIFTDELEKNINKNKPKIALVLKGLLDPLASAARDAMGIIPGFGELIAVYLAIKNTVLSVANGANVMSSTVDNFVTIPLKKVFKTTHEAINNANEMKDDANEVQKDLNNILKLCREFHKESQKVQKMVDNGTSLDTMLEQPRDIPRDIPAITDETKKVKGGGQHIVKSTTRRINKWVKRFNNTVTRKNMNIYF